MTGLVRGRGGAYDVRPAGEHPGIRNAFGICKDSFQGACAGLLSLLGVTHMTSAPDGVARIHSEAAWLDTLWGSLSAGGIAGPMELLGGIALFFAARRSISRLIGLLAFVGFLVAYMKGYSLIDMLNLLSSATGGLAERLDARTV